MRFEATPIDEERERRVRELFDSSLSNVGELVVRVIEPKGLVMTRPKSLRLGPAEIEALNAVADERILPPSNPPK